ncbi:RuBisCO operon transcriptional regulator CbbR [hydrothermal vent metagenome]|uniref:RuBisCO operon transcriptional regulator CbbR n=1 Tax=hydrothermal vent metagenome TaxID=652676 RepID=A0A3B1AZ23_9ZZZZ
MKFTLRQLKVFAAVAKCSSYTRAAEELYLSQPAVSIQVKQLEEHVGMALFEQIGKKINLTPAGKEVQHYCHAIFQQINEMEDVLEAMQGLSSGRLDIAVASTINYFAPRLLAAFNRRYPNIDLTLEVTNRETLKKRLEANEKDIFLMGLLPEKLDLHAVPFMENPLVVIAPPDHPLTQERNIPLQRLAEETFLTREAGSGTRLSTERFFHEKNITLRTGMEMSRNAAIKQAVRGGMGLAVVSIHTIELEVETGRLLILDVEDFPILRTWHIVHLRGKRLSPAAQAFYDFVLGENMQQLIGSD